jgi:hypothetical protein
VRLGMNTKSPPLDAILATKPRLHLALLIVVGVLATASVFVGLRSAQTSSKDLQWQPLTVFWQAHRDPYQEFLKIDPWHVHTVPQLNLHLANFVLAPLGFMSLSNAKLFWSIANLVFLTATGWIMRRLPDVRMPAIVGLVLLCSAPIRGTISNGQISLFCLFCFTLFLMLASSRPKLAAMFAGIGAMKYSVGAPLFFQMPLTWLNILAFWALHLAAIAFWTMHFHLSLTQALSLPFQVVAKLGLADNGTGDLVMLLRSVGINPLIVNGVAATAMVGVSIVQRRYFPTTDRLLLFAFYATLALWLVYHRVYDFVFLLPVATIAVRTQTTLVRYGLLALTLYFWFIMTAMVRLSISPPGPGLNFLLLLCMQILLACEISARNREAAIRLDLGVCASAHKFEAAKSEATKAATSRPSFTAKLVPLSLG